VEVGGAGITGDADLGIPYSSLKGVFKLRQWDSRPVGARSGVDAHVNQVARILAERDGAGRRLPRPERSLISRVHP